MDESKPELTFGMSLPNSDFVYRLIPKDLVEKDKFTPRIRGFSLSREDKMQGYGLSVDWSSLTTPEESIARVGASFKKDTIKYKDYNTKDIYSLSVSFLKSIEAILDVVHDPKMYPTPIEGSPNNPSHSLVIFSPEELEKNETEIYSRIREHAKDKKQTVNTKKIEEFVHVYRSTSNT